MTVKISSSVFRAIWLTAVAFCPIISFSSAALIVNQTTTITSDSDSDHGGRTPHRQRHRARLQGTSRKLGKKDDYDDDEDDDSELKLLQKELASLQETLADTQMELAKSQAMLVESESNLMAVQQELAETNAQLDQAWSNATACEISKGAKILYVQMVRTFLAEEDAQDGNFYLQSSDFSPLTWSFTDRPIQLAESVTTDYFFQNFDNIFTNETGGAPNAAITCTHDPTGLFLGPIILVLERAFTFINEQNETVYKYQISQSESQGKGTFTFDQIREFNKNFTMEERTWSDCSIFIDSLISKKKRKTAKRLAKSLVKRATGWNPNMDDVSIATKFARDYALAKIERFQPYYAGITTGNIANNKLYKLGKGPLLQQASRAAEVGQRIGREATKVTDAIVDGVETAIDSINDFLDAFTCLVNGAVTGSMLNCIERFKAAIDLLNDVVPIAEARDMQDTLERGLKKYKEVAMLVIKNIGELFKSSKKSVKVPAAGILNDILKFDDTSGPSYQIPERVPYIAIQDMDSSLIEQTIRVAVSVIFGPLRDTLISIVKQLNLRRKLSELNQDERDLNEKLIPDICFWTLLGAQFPGVPTPPGLDYAPYVQVGFCIDPKDPDNFDKMSIPFNAGLGYFATAGETAFSLEFLINTAWTYFNDQSSSLDSNAAPGGPVSNFVVSFPTLYGRVDVTGPRRMPDFGYDVGGSVNFNVGDLSLGGTLAGNGYFTLKSFSTASSDDPLSGAILTGFAQFTMGAGFIEKFPSGGGGGINTGDEDDPFQGFSLEEAIADLSVTSSLPTPAVMIKISTNSDCLTNSGGDLVLLKPCDGSEEQLWSLNEDLLQNLKNPDQCLNGHGRLGSCDPGDPTMQFDFRSDGKIVSKADSTRCVDDDPSCNCIGFLCERCIRMGGCSSAPSFFWLTESTILHHELPSKQGFYCMDASTKGLAFCTGISQQQLILTSSSMIFSPDGKALTRYENTGANAHVPGPFIDFSANVNGGTRQQFIFTGDGYLQQNGGDRDCMGYYAGLFGAVGGNLDPDLLFGPCALFDRKELMSDQEFHMVRSEDPDRPACLRVTTGGSLSVNSNCPVGNLYYYWKLSRGQLIHQYDQTQCIVPINGELRVTPCSSDRTSLYTTWSYDSDNFWLVYEEAGQEPQCLILSGRRPSLTDCNTSSRQMMWGRKDYMEDSSIREQFYFSALPTKIHVISDDKCLRGTSPTPSMVADCSLSRTNWFINPVTKRLQVDGTSLCLHDSGSSVPRVQTCSTANSWSYDPQTRKLEALPSPGSDQESRCLEWNNGFAFFNCEKNFGVREGTAIFGASVLWGPRFYPAAFSTMPIPSQIKRGAPFSTNELNADEWCLFRTHDRVSWTNNIQTCENQALWNLTPEGRLVLRGATLYTLTKSSNALLSGIEGFVPDGSLYLWSYDPETLRITSIQDPKICLRNGISVYVYPLDSFGTPNGVPNAGRCLNTPDAIEQWVM